MKKKTHIEASFDAVIITSNDLKFGKPPHKFFILVDGLDGKKYQIKFNEHKQRNNINEYIAYTVGEMCDMPLVDHTFIKLHNEDIEEIEGAMSEYGDTIRKVDFGLHKENLFFAVEWKQHVTKIDTEDELLDRVMSVSNGYSFFSLYPFDQSLKNYDRHLGNHLVAKESKITKYYLIDFDRIFSSTNWHRIEYDYKCFLPFAATSQGRDYHLFLLSLVTDKTLKFVNAYTGKIASILDEDIKKMCDTMLGIFDISKKEVEAIEQWFLYRKSEIAMECLKNEAYFPRVKKGLYSAK